MKRVYALLIVVFCIVGIGFAQEINRQIVSFTINGQDATSKYFQPFCEGDDLDVHFIKLIHKTGSDGVLSDDLSNHATDSILYSESDFMEKKGDAFIYSARVIMWENSAAEKTYDNVVFQITKLGENAYLMEYKIINSVYIIKYLVSLGE